MNCYTHNDFRGRWPVGTAAVVMAETPELAATALEVELTSCGLKQDINPEDMQLLEQGVRILCDGDY